MKLSRPELATNRYVIWSPCRVLKEPARSGSYQVDEGGPTFDAFIAHQDGMVLVIVRGEIDIAVTGRFNEVVADAVARSPHVVFDMSRVTFLGASGLRVLLSAAENVDPGGSVTVRDGSRPVRRVLSVSGVDQVVTVES